MALVYYGWGVGSICTADDVRFIDDSETLSYTESVTIAVGVDIVTPVEVKSFPEGTIDIAEGEDKLPSNDTFMKAESVTITNT